MEANLLAHAFGSASIWQFIDQFPIDFGRKRQHRTIGAFTFNAPGIRILDDGHPASYSPPRVNLARKRSPELMFVALLTQPTKQGLVHRPRVVTVNVVRMNDEACQAILLENQADLLLPQIDRPLVQYVK